MICYENFSAHQKMVFKNELFRMLYKKPDIKSAGYYFVMDLIYWNYRANGISVYERGVLLEDLIFQDIIHNHKK